MDCIFCKIINGEIPSYKIYEDDEFLGILDVFPSHHAQSLLIPKVHKSSKFTDNDEDFLGSAIIAAKKVADKIEKGLDEVERCQIVIEGFQVPHFHIKLYPAQNDEPTKYTLTESGPKAEDEKLKQLAEKINS